MKTARPITIILLAFLLAAWLPNTAIADIIGKITAIEGDVDVLRQGLDKTIPVKIIESISEGDIIRTKSNAKAEITFIDNTVVRLAPGTRLQVTEYLMEGDKRESGVINLFRGKIRATVTKSRVFLGIAFGKKERFEVRTPTAVVGVKGTDFFIYHLFGITGIFVIDGSIDAFNHSFPKKVVSVNGGNATFVAENELPKIPRSSHNTEIVRHIKDTDPNEKPKKKNKRAAYLNAEQDNITDNELETINMEDEMIFNYLNTTTDFSTASLDLYSPDIFAPTVSIPTDILPEITPPTIPFAEVGNTSLTGSGYIGGPPATANLNNVTFFAYSNGAPAQIWTTSNVQGTYTCSACGSATIPVTGGGLSADFNVQTFDISGQTWTATITNGSGTYSGTGTMNGTNVQFDGTASGTNTGIGPGTFVGTASGVVQ